MKRSGHNPETVNSTSPQHQTPGQDKSKEERWNPQSINQPRTFNKDMRRGHRVEGRRALEQLEEDAAQ